ncbi:endonuclease/exonuclease/phosphatase family protein [Lentilitoribacter sp. EG35]|jgi:predicted extracellular nuclease|uniref:endonuclease/exonuclease/phosphatase family protein n=1 Tax=Lentilitoribacter sp. EG35 TaxID=3234192 RepID=UPI003460D40E
MVLRIATFNAENLLSRFDFSGFERDHRQDRVNQLYDPKDKEQYKQMEIARIVSLTDDTRQLTALAIADTDADIVCLQEVEDIDTLSAFERGYLYKMVGEGYRQKYLAEGNDRRGIDVGVMMREQTRDGQDIEFVRMQSHAHVTYEDFDLFTEELSERYNPKDRIFKRDCLEIDVLVGGKPLTIYVVHFKSMGSSRNGLDGKTYTMPVRAAEAKAVRKIIEKRFGKGKTDSKRFIICGDMNDYDERVVVTGDRRTGYDFKVEHEKQSAIDVFLSDGFTENVIQRRSELDRWTVYHTRGPDVQHLCQLDYILLSPALAKSSASIKPDIIRAGQPWRTVFPDGQDVERYPRVGWDRPKASDHCPLAMSINIV